MSIAGSPDIFQEKMLNFMRILDYIHVYLDYLLTITRGTLKNHLSQLEIVIHWLQKAGLGVNAVKSNFAYDKFEYLGCILTRD